MTEVYKDSCLQTIEEIEAFCALLAAEGVKSYLEIGSKFGGSLWRVANALPKGSRIVSVDLNVNGPPLKNCIKELNAIGYDAHLIEGNSTNLANIRQAQLLSPFDAIFIDGDHLLPGVTADWNNYSPMGRIIAFHDITWRRGPEWTGKRIEVAALWDEVKQGNRFQEIKLEKKGKNNGIGVLWRS